MRRYKEAYAIYDEIYEVRKSILGNMHPDTLAVEFYLARLKFMNGKKDEGIELMSEVYKKRCLILGKDHLDTKRSIKTLEEMHRKNTN